MVVGVGGGGRGDHSTEEDSLICTTIVNEIHIVS